MKKRYLMAGMMLLLVYASGAAAFEILTAEEIKTNVIKTDVFVRTADNFVVLVDASGSMKDPYRDDVTKLTAELEILKQQNALLPELGYNAGLYLFTPFRTYYEMQPYNRDQFAAAIDSLPKTTREASTLADQPTPLAEGIKALDPILAKLTGKTVVFIFSDGTYTFGGQKLRPLDTATALAQKYNVCFYLVSSATTPKATQMLDDMAAVNECSRVVAFDQFYDNPVVGAGPLYVVDSKVEIETITEKQTVGAKARNVEFAFDQVDVLPGDHNNLKQVAEFLQNNPKSFAVLAGFSDNSGDPEYNLKLSRMRAQSVKNFILQQGRFDPDRVIDIWYGATNFIADNDTEEGRQKNRRVEIAIGMLE
ncbi:MAG: OmpA family protein [Desulfobacterales bacterium]